MKRILFLMFLGLFLSGCVCIPCDAVEPGHAPAKVVKQCGPWILVQRGEEAFWLYDVGYATKKVTDAGKTVVYEAVEATGFVLETTGDVVIGVGVLTLEAGNEVIRRLDCAVKGLILPRNCAPGHSRSPSARPAHPPVRRRDLHPPRVKPGIPVGPVRVVNASRE
tara:strand:+ start:48012 stop:48506 length:495 start_codon:yes stop_codon:yes gene_type:complete